MFPQDIQTDSDNTTYNVISDSSEIHKTPNFDYNEMASVLKNGNIDLVNDYQNVRNWIIKFIRTPIDVYSIYEGSGFGTSAYLLKGYKGIPALIYAQIKSEIETGFLLNPNIVAVKEVELTKNENVLEIYVKCQLIDGYILENKTEVYKLK